MTPLEMARWEALGRPDDCPYCWSAGGLDTPLARAPWDVWSKEHQDFHAIEATATEVRRLTSSY